MMCADALESTNHQSMACCCVLLASVPRATMTCSCSHALSRQQPSSTPFRKLESQGTPQAQLEFCLGFLRDSASHQHPTGQSPNLRHLAQQQDTQAQAQQQTTEAPKRLPPPPAQAILPMPSPSLASDTYSNSAHTDHSCSTKCSSSAPLSPCPCCLCSQDFLSHCPLQLLPFPCFPCLPFLISLFLSFPCSCHLVVPFLVFSSLSFIILVSSFSFITLVLSFVLPLKRTGMITMIALPVGFCDLPKVPSR